jgi:hypothetical protein
MAAPLILIEASPRLVSTGATATVRLAGGGAFSPYYYGGQHWRAGVVQLPTFITSLSFDGGDFGAGGIPQAAEIQWAPTTKADLAAMAAYYWPDAAITVRIGVEGALPPVRLTGKVLDAPIDGGVLKLQLSDPAASIRKPLLTARYGGTGGLDGPADWEGKIKRRVWGRIWNLAGEPIDKANNIYAFADPLQRLQAFDAVRDKGAPASSLTTLAWQGTSAATLAALQAATAPTGGGVVCPSIACVKWWTKPAGDLTADLRGEIGASYVETAPEIAERIVGVLGGVSFTSGTVAAAKALRGAAVGWIARDENTTAAAQIEQLLGDNSLLWLLDQSGAIAIKPYAWGSPIATATSLKVGRKNVLKPLATRKIGYQRNETQMARGDIAAILFAEDVSFGDGTALQALQPAEAGATKGAPVGTPVGSKTAADVAATIKTGGGVADDKVSTPAISDMAVTKTSYATRSSDISLPDATDVDIFSLTVNKDQAASLIRLEACVIIESSDDIRGTFTFYDTAGAASPQDYGVYANGAGGTFRLPLTFIALFAGVGTGSRTFRLKFRRNGGASSVSAKTGSLFSVREEKK